MHGLTPEPGGFRKDDDWESEEEPGLLPLLGYAYISLLKQPSRIFNLVKHTVESLNLPAEIGQIKDKMEDHGIKEVTRFNHEVSPHRVFGAVPMELDRLKAIKNAVGESTLNEVVLSVTSGALRRYLVDKDELPEPSLIAGVPKSTCSSEDVNASGGNSVSGMRISLRTDIADPIERLKKSMLMPLPPKSMPTR